MAGEGGFIKLHRGWRDNPLFGREYSRGDAWIWMLEHACWKPAKVKVKGKIVTLERGEMSFSVRFLAGAWGWSKSRVDRFIAELRAEGMIETRSKIGTTAGHSAGQGQSILTICNYAKYQDRDGLERDNDEPEGGTSAGQQRDKEEEGKEVKKEEKKGGGASYAFFGRTIRLNDRDLAGWKRVYSAIPDLEAELNTIDAWWQGQDDPAPKNWFYRTSQMLNRKHQERLAAGNDDGEWEVPLC